MSESVSRADQVAEELRSAIIARVYPPGSRLSAMALAERFQVSQTPLREAFARLAGEGWVSYLPQRGVRVTEISIKDMVDIYDLRELLEPVAMSRATVNGDDNWRALVQATYKEMIALAHTEPTDLGTEGYQSFELAHTRFHRILMQECSSRWLIRLTNLLIDQSARYRPLSLPVRDRTGSPLNEHNHLRLAALAGDADEMLLASRLHMQNTKQALLDWLEHPENDEAGELPLNGQG